MLLWEAVSLAAMSDINCDWKRQKGEKIIYILEEQDKIKTVEHKEDED